MIIDKNVLSVIRSRMQRRGLRDYDIEFFLKAWQSMDTAVPPIAWERLKPLGSSDVLALPDDRTETARLEEVGRTHIHQCAIVKLNGGRSTTMGGLVPKCMVTAKNGKSFLDIVMGQVMAANDYYNIEMPLILMNSFFTDHVTEKIVGRTPLIILNFIQNEYPRIRKDTFLPLDTGTDDDWCPAGHGDFYTGIAGSGMLDNLLELGLRYVFISNIDNLSAEISPAILGRMVEGGHDFLMEVTRKTQDDVKGGAPVFDDGRLSLLEIGQVPAEHHQDFQDIETFQYFNTNNLWVDLLAVKEMIHHDQLRLPIILNHKRCAETDIIQIETAMGAGLECFSRPGLIEVSRDRFAPVKKLSDLFLLQSDVYSLNERMQLTLNTERPKQLPRLPRITFHSGFPSGNQLEGGFADPACISLLHTESLTVGGKVVFAGEQQIRGVVRVENGSQQLLTVTSENIGCFQQETAT